MVRGSRLATFQNAQCRLIPEWRRRGVARETARPAVRVAGIGLPEGVRELNAYRQAYDPVLPDEEHERMSRVPCPLHDRLLADTLREAKAGAKLVVWHETVAPVFLEDEPALLEQGRQLPPVAGLSEAENQQAWQILQAELVGLSSQSTHVADQSDHDIPLEQPYVVPGDARRFRTEFRHGVVWTDHG